MVNKATILGRLTKDVDMRFSSSGVGVANFSVATNEKYKNKAGEKVETVEFHNVVAFGRLAEICGEYLSKGSLIYIEGKIKTDSWKDKEGNTKYATKIEAREMKMLGNKQGKKEESNGEEDVPDFNDPSIPF